MKANTGPCSVAVCLRQIGCLGSVQRKECHLSSTDIRKRPKTVRSVVLSWQRAWIDYARKLYNQAHVWVWKLQLWPQAALSKHVPAEGATSGICVCELKLDLGLR